MAADLRDTNDAGSTITIAYKIATASEGANVTVSGTGSAHQSLNNLRVHRHRHDLPGHHPALHRVQNRPAATASQRFDRGHRIKTGPCLVIRPQRTSSLDSRCLGVSPAHEHNCRAGGNRVTSPISATNTAPSTRSTPPMGLDRLIAEGQVLIGGDGPVDQGSPSSQRRPPSTSPRWPRSPNGSGPQSGPGSSGARPRASTDCSRSGSITPVRRPRPGP